MVGIVEAAVPERLERAVKRAGPDVCTADKPVAVPITGPERVTLAGERW
ncbi:hypothetical protein [Umezawaea tangerina]|uniref:Uncharacterized protein n=1 Tax=Umezawaea tangerina TaxID=84725 RepID=A0A2T0T2J8_9PSEU|nr:hypothetical protein [Umezawaea tangerina]PRY39864.1 hypothetical protein CLV43_107451 [Umezawaea tangerina]